MTIRLPFLSTGAVALLWRIGTRIGRRRRQPPPRADPQLRREPRAAPAAQHNSHAAAVRPAQQMHRGGAADIAPAMAAGGNTSAAASGDRRHTRDSVVDLVQPDRIAIDGDVDPAEAKPVARAIITCRLKRCLQ